MSQAKPSPDTGRADDVRDPIEEIAEHFVARLRAGEHVTIEQYQHDYPQHAAQIEALFPTLLLMEDVKPPTTESSRRHDSADTLLERNLKRLGDYRIIRRIGYGGMGIVYEAEQESLGRRVAIKVFAPTLFSSARQIRRFKREAQAAGQLHHSNIVAVLGVGEQWGIHYYIMQFVDGQSLDRVLGKQGEREPPFDVQGNWVRIAAIGRQIADALHYAHAHDVWHRDIKPANLLLDHDGTAWVTDFGLAKLTSSDEGVTRTGQTVGTLRYMAPEQLQGHFDARSDVYALGLTLYELVTWQRAFGESDHRRLVKQKTTEIPAQPRSIEPGIPQDLETIVMKAIAREPRHRYQTAGQLGEDLDRFMRDLPIRARRLSTAERVYRWSRRNPALATAGVLILGLAVTIAGVMVWSYVRIQRALASATEQQVRAAVSASLATGALDSIFDRFGIESIDGTPRVEPTLSSEAAALLEELIRYYDRLADDDSGSQLMAQKAAEAQLKIGNIRMRLGQYELAMEAYDLAAEKFRALDAFPECRLKLARVLNHRGQVMRWMGQSGQDQHLAAVDLLDAIASDNSIRSSADRLTGPHASAVALEPLEPQMRYERARAHFLLATRVRPGMGPDSLPPAAAIQQESLERLELEVDAQEWLHAAQAELTALVDEFPDRPPFRQLLAQCLREQASDRLADRSLGDQRAEQQAIEILEDLVRAHPDHLDYQFDLVATLAEVNVFGDSLRPRDYDAMKSRLERAIELGESLVTKRPDLTLYASSLVHAHYKLATVESSAAEHGPGTERPQHLATAEQHCRAAIARQADLIRRFPTAVGFAAWQALFRSQLAALLLDLGELDESQYQATAAIFLIEQLMQVSADSMLYPMADQAYRTLDGIFAQLGTPQELLPSEISRF